MSMPKFPIDPASLSRDDVINQILASIAMEELALSHVINAEGEKIQYVLGALEGSTPPELATVEEVLQVNQSVEKTLEVAAKKQMILTQKMTEALSASTMQGTTGPTGPQGPQGNPGLITVIPIIVDEYLALPDDQKRSTSILWVIYPDDFFVV